MRIENVLLKNKMTLDKNARHTAGKYARWRKTTKISGDN
jgi:hypothetical protein